MNRFLLFGMLLLLGGCGMEGDEGRLVSPEPTKYREEVVFDTIVSVEARVGPGRPVNDSIRATGVTIPLAGLFHVAELSATVGYGPDLPEYHKEVFSVGLALEGTSIESAVFPVDSSTGLPGVPDPNPGDDEGVTLERYIGRLVVAPGNYQIVVAHGQFFDPAGDWPDVNDPLISRVRVRLINRIPI